MGLEDVYVMMWSQRSVSSNLRFADPNPHNLGKKINSCLTLTKRQLFCGKVKEFGLYDDLI